MEAGGGPVEADEAGTAVAPTRARSSRIGFVVVALVGVVVVAGAVGYAKHQRRAIYKQVDVPWLSVTASEDGRSLTFQAAGGCEQPGTVSFEGDPTRDATVTATAHYRVLISREGHDVFCSSGFGMLDPVVVALDGSVTPGLVVTDGAPDCGHSQVIEEPPPPGLSSPPTC